jgi:hypothetical protein
MVGLVIEWDALDLPAFTLNTDGAPRVDVMREALGRVRSIRDMDASSERRMPVYRKSTTMAVWWTWWLRAQQPAILVFIYVALSCLLAFGGMMAAAGSEALLAGPAL